jgi:rhamnulokinase
MPRAGRFLQDRSEATAIGNILIQAIAGGHLASLAGLRKIVRDSFPITELHPAGNPERSEASARFESHRQIPTPVRQL